MRVFKLPDHSVREFSATQVIALGFAAAIAVGTALLSLPAATNGPGHAGFSEALFTSCSSVCVTGLTIVDTFSYWSFFGQLVILLLIQCGGLGIVALTTGVMLILGQRTSLRDRLVLESAFNLNSLNDLVPFLLRVVKGTFIAEAAGALCYMPVFVKGQGVRGVWNSIFLSVSAFCNCGMDTIGADSLKPYAGSIWINAVTMALVILGGIGFIVWWDILDVIGLVRRGDIPRRQCLRRLRLHTKLTLSMSVLLIIGGTIVILAFEYTNPFTLGGMSFGKKLLAALFQSVTTRSAGFATISQNALREPTIFVCMFLMFTGGSSTGTAGGVKTTTIALTALSAAATANGSDDTVAFRRTVPQSTIKRANSVVLISFLVLCFMTVIICACSGDRLIHAAFETTGAISTAGMTLDFTKELNAFGRAMILLCMYLGRIGPISLALVIDLRQKRRALARYAEENVTVG